MRTINKVILIGNITRDPVIKTTESNKKVALFTIATNRQYKTAEGEQKSESEFHYCVAWWSLAERCEKFLKKWKLVYTEGRLKTRAIEKEDWTKTYKTEIVMSNLIFLNKKSDFESLENELDENDFDEDDKF